MGSLIISLHLEFGLMAGRWQSKPKVILRGTNYLIMVDCSAHKVGVFRGSVNNWSLQYSWRCVTGAPSTPTIKGTFHTTGFKRNSLSTDSRAIYCTQIWGGYFFHSILASRKRIRPKSFYWMIRLPYSGCSVDS